MDQWRRIDHGPGSGPFNMGVDEALLRSAEQGRPSIRFYRWSGEWVSLGYSQECEPKFAGACARVGVDWVRRVTGGRALLHGHDLTYAVAAPRTALPGSVREVAARIAMALERGLRDLGIPASRTSADRPAPGAEVFDCFSQPGGNEIILDGRKLVGSAQRRTRQAVLQHGSICLSPHSAEARRATQLAANSSISLQEWGSRVSDEDLREALAAALGDSLGVELQTVELAPDEAQEASQRLQEPSPRSLGRSTGSQEGG